MASEWPFRYPKAHKNESIGSLSGRAPGIPAIKDTGLPHTFKFMAIVRQLINKMGFAKVFRLYFGWFNLHIWNVSSFLR